VARGSLQPAAVRPHLAFPVARALVVLLALSPWALASAQPARRSITLREAIALGIRGNPSLAAAGADVGMAEGAVEAARGLDDFVLDAGASWRKSRRIPLLDDPLQQLEADEVTGIGATLGLTKPIASGGRLGLRLNNDYTRTPSRNLPQAYTPSLQLTLQHPLLRGFGPAVARAEQRRASVQRDRAGLERVALASGLVRELVAAYWDLGYATQELVIRRAAADSAREQLKRVEANIEVGKQPRSASAEIEVAIALRDEGVLFSEQTLFDRALELGRLLGLPARDAAALAASDTPEAPARLPTLDATLAAALASSPQLQAVRAQGRAAAIEVDVTENGMLPQLDLALSGGPMGNAHDARTALEQLRDLESYGVTASLVFQQALGRHAARGARTIAREAQRKARLTEADIALQISSAAVRAMNAVEIAGRRVEVLARSRDAAAVDLEAERARFEVGRATNFDVLRRQQDVAQVQLAHLRARVDQLKAMAAVQSLTGEILETHGVTFR
jgi:outer membrane protein TolC